MVRNVILLISTAGLLGVLFVAYVSFFGVPGPSGDEPGSVIEPLTAATPAADEGAVQIRGVTVPGGGETAFTIYDERTGRPTDHFRCKSWSWVDGSTDEARVTQPELTMLLPSGMVATISADEGQITVDRTDKARMRPKLGWLAGDARIRIDREMQASRTAWQDRPEDQILIEMERLHFDLERGELRAEGRVSASSADMRVSGSGLRLLWNQADNRIETVTIERGEELSVPVSGRLIRGGAPGAAASAPAVSAAPQTAPAASAPARKAAAYECVLGGGVTVQHRREQETLGQLVARELRLHFEAGGAALLGASNAAASQSSQPAAESVERLVVRWNGRFTLAPAARALRPGEARRRIEALGPDVRLSTGDSTVRCERLEYHEDARRLWLYAPDGGAVEFELGGGLWARADCLYLDQARNVIKLIGGVWIRSARDGRGSSDAVTIECGSWAQLHLAAPPATAPVERAGDLAQAQRLRSAVFSGEVRVRIGGRELRGDRVETTFAAVGSGGTLDEMLETAVARGDVRLSAGEQRFSCGWLTLGFARTPEGKTYPCAAEAIGDVLLNDPPQRVSARGSRLQAEFGPNEQLERATIYGDGRDAAVRSAAYLIRGGAIVMDGREQTLHVDGPSRLSFRSARSLQGAERARPQITRVRSQTSLHIDAAGDTVQFVGGVEAVSGYERLLADSLTLLLERVAEGKPRTRPVLAELLGSARSLLGDGSRGSSAGLFGAAQADRGTRREPVRLIAQNAIALTESIAEGELQPLTHQSIAAPELNVDIRGRTLRTTGQTTLGMISRVLEDAGERRADDLGVPSALMTRGPSQTVLQCSRALTYVVGAESPQRRDTVLLEGEVRFVHVAGREMVGLEQMVPQVRDNPELLNRLVSRNTSMSCGRLEAAFVTETAGTDGGAGRRSQPRMTWLSASEAVDLRDQQGTRVRTVSAARLEFDRDNSLVRVFGAAGVDARIFDEDVSTGQLNIPAVGPEFVVNLADNSVRAGETSGRFSRP
jgi:hypothetical protein